MGEANRKKLIQQVRQRAFEQHNGIFRPRVAGDIKTTWPVCMTCKQDVDRVNVEDVGQQVVTIRAWCHGKEAVLKIEFPFNIQRRDDDETWRHVQTAINASTFFDPSIA